MAKQPNPDEQIREILAELRIYGFAAVKAIAELRGVASGTMECPLCQQDLRFSVSPSNGHLRAACSTNGCINAME